MWSFRNNMYLKSLISFSLTFSLFMVGLEVRAKSNIDSPPALFIGVGTEITFDQSADSRVFRRRSVEIDFNLLPNSAETNMEFMTHEGRLVLNLFSDMIFTAVPERLESVTAGSISWIGHVEGVSYSRVIMVYKDGRMIGTVSLPAALIKIYSNEDGGHNIDQFNLTAFPPEAKPLPAGTQQDSVMMSEDIIAPDTGSMIDVMVLYTPAARAAVGGATNMQLLISTALTETNDSFALSGINPRLNLVHYAEVSYTESGSFTTDLSRLRETNDGYMDEIHGWRDTYAADEVSLIIDDSTYCGMGYIMTTVSTSFAPYAFYLVYWDCATGYYSFGHELGHNMGARHDWYVDDTPDSPYSYNHGYINRQDKWRTIMAYNNACSDGGLGYCTRLQYWANPDLTYGGDPLGVPAGTSTACIEGVLDPDCDADNRLTLNNTAWTVSNFRNAAPPPLNDDFDDAEVILYAPFTDILDMGSATMAGDDPTFTCVNGQRYNTVWYRWSPSRDGVLTVNTFDSNYDTVLAVWTGSRGSLMSQACNDDAVGGASEVNLFATSGVMYYIEVASYSDISSGELHLALEFIPQILPGDFDGDGIADIGFFRAPEPGLWGILESTEAFDSNSAQWFGWGQDGDLPVLGDYDGDGKTDPTVRRPPEGGQSAAILALLSSTGYDYGQYLIIPAGWPSLGDIPVPADYDGDGITDPAIWRESQGVWIIPLSGGNYSTYTFASWGVGGDSPVGADVDGDGKADIGFFRASSGLWGFLKSSTGYSLGDPVWFSWGGPMETPMMADYDGDGLADPAFVTPPAGGESAAYRILLSSTGYDYGQALTIAAGWPSLGDTPVPGDFDGDGKAEPGIWRGSTGVWIIAKSSCSYSCYMFALWGESGDIVLPNMPWLD